MEIKFNVPKKAIISILAIPILLVATTYLYFFWGKPSDVRQDIWLEGKKFHNIEKGYKQLSSDSDWQNWGVELGKFLYKHRAANKGAIRSNYSVNEVKIISNIESVNEDRGACLEKQPSDDDIEKCKYYNDSLDRLDQYFE